MSARGILQVSDAAQASSPPIGWATKLLYGVGSIAFGVKDQGFNAFLLIFYNQIVGLPAAWVGASIAIALAIDAFIDPVIGQVSDNWRSSWGRRHPFMYFAALPAALGYALIWIPPQSWPHEAMFAYLIGLIVIVRAVIAMYEIPSTALAAELTGDYRLRTSLIAYRWLCVVIGGIAVTMITFGLILTPTPDQPNGVLNARGYVVYALFAGAVMLASILASTLGTHKHIPRLHAPPADRNRSLRTMLAQMRETVTQRSFLIIAAAGVFLAMGAGLGAGLNTYILIYFWRFTAQEIAPLVLGTAIGAVFAFAVSPWATARFGKRNGGLSFAVLSALIGNAPPTLRLLGLFPPPGDPALWPILFLVSSIAGGLGLAALIMIGSMIADIVDEGEAATGRRSEGLFFAANSFIQKTVSGVGVFLSGLILAAVAFPQNAAPDAIDPRIVHNLVLIFLPANAALFACAVAILMLYKDRPMPVPARAGLQTELSA